MQGTTPSTPGLSTEACVHGGYLHLARLDLGRRLAQPSPSLYDCLLAAIYFRKSGDQQQALQALALHAGSPVFEHTYNRLQSLCHGLAFAEAAQVAQDALDQRAGDWSEAQRGYAQELLITTGTLAASGGYPTPLQLALVEPNRYHNLDSGERTDCTGVVDGSRRRGRLVDAVLDPVSHCWLDRVTGGVITELLQPNHDLRGFFGGAQPAAVAPEACTPLPPDQLSALAVYVQANPHYGHFLTQSASYANAIGYAEHLLGSADAAITVLSQDAIPPWGQELLQLGCRRELEFRVIAPALGLRAERLVVAPQTWMEWHYAHRDHRRPFRQAAWAVLGSGEGGDAQGSEAISTRKLYFSRSRLGLCLRRSVNEEALEIALEAKGFEIIHPQELPLQEVIRLVNQAAVIAGASGSAMHNVLFRLPGAPLVTLTFAHELPAINGALVERCSGIEHNLYLRSCEEEEQPVGDPNRLHFSISRCLEGVDAALALL